MSSPNEFDIRDPSEAIQVVTPITARHWLDNYNYDRQRRLRPLHVKALAREILEGRFRDKTQISFCRLKGAYHLVNGQHTLSAIHMANVPTRLSVTVTEVASDDAVADEFTRHDTHLTRSTSDALYAHRVDEELALSATELQRVTAAAVVYSYMIGEISSNATTSIPHDIKLALVRSRGPIIRDAVRAIGWPLLRKNSAWCYRKSLLATIAITYYYQPAISVEFWGGIAADDGLAANDPRKILLKKYEQSTMHTGVVGRKAGGELIHESHIPKLAATAWNAFVDRRPLTFLRIDHAARKAFFAGCGEVQV